MPNNKETNVFVLMSDLLSLFCDCHWNWNECLPATECLVEDTTTGSELKTLLKTESEIFIAVF